MNFKTYQEAKIFFPRCDICVSEGGVFRPVKMDTGKGLNDGWTVCHPSEYLISLDSFLNDGLKVENGDTLINNVGDVVEVGGVYNGIIIYESFVNERMPYLDCELYVLSAKCINEKKHIETPEEKEALDMIDTTSKQVESLAKGDDTNQYLGWCEWEVYHGERWIPCIRLGKDIYGNYAYQLAEGEFEGEFNGTPDLSSFRKLESPEQKAERERDETIKKIQRDMAFSGSDYRAAERLYEKGYRKELK